MAISRLDSRFVYCHIAREGIKRPCAESASQSTCSTASCRTTVAEFEFTYVATNEPTGEIDIEGGSMPRNGQPMKNDGGRLWWKRTKGKQDKTDICGRTIVDSCNHDTPSAIMRFVPVLA